MLFFCADFPREQGTNCTGGARRRSCLAKRMECVELAPAVGCVARFESGSKLHALHTLRAIWFRLCRAEDRRALPTAVTEALRQKSDCNRGGILLTTTTGGRDRTVAGRWPQDQ